MFANLRNLRNWLIHLLAILTVLGSTIVLITWVALFICAVAILIKAVLVQTVTMVRIMTKKVPTNQPRPHSLKPDIVPTSNPDEEHVKVLNPVIHELAVDLDRGLPKLRHTTSKMEDPASKATDTTSGAQANLSRSSKANYKYVTADLRHQLHGIRSQRFRSLRKVADKRELKPEQALRTPRRRFHGDEAEFPRLVRKAAVADLHAPNAPSRTCNDEDWIDVDDDTSAKDRIIDKCLALERKLCRERLMLKEKLNAKKAIKMPSSSFDEFKAEHVMHDKPIISFDELAALYYENIRAEDGNVSTTKFKDIRVKTKHDGNRIGQDTPMKEGKSTKANHADLAATDLINNIGLKIEERRSRSSTAMPVEEGKKMKMNGANMAREYNKKLSHSGCLFLNLLPAEIRNLIYSYVLTTPVPIRNAGELVEQMAVGLVVADEPDPSMRIGIDAALMRTCRRVYAETLPVLYGENIFQFKSVELLKKFRNTGLVQTQEEQTHYRMISTFNLKANSNGRLSAIRKLSLNLTAEVEHFFDPRPGSRAVPSRKMITYEWGTFLHQDRRGILGADYIDFPMLEFLSLDFSDWHLGTNEGLVIRPFIDKFRVSQGLRKLVIRGVSHEKSLAQLKKQLLREGGIFEVHKGT